MSLEPDTLEFIQRLVARGARPLHALPLAELRAAIDDLTALLPPGRTDLAAVEDVGVGESGAPVPVRLYKPLGRRPFGMLVYAHGGGFVAGSPDTSDAICRELCARAGRVVVSVDYRLAPEHPFPAAVDDCLLATRWALASAERLEGDPHRVVIGGDSAGGTLAAVCAQSLRGEAGFALQGQLLLYPMTDARAAFSSRATNARGPMLTSADIARFVTAYLGSNASAMDSRCSPLRADHLRHLPPALVATCGFDPLRDEGDAYAEALEAAGNHVTHHRYPRGVHGHFGFFGVLETGRRMMDDAVVWLRR